MFDTKSQTPFNLPPSNFVPDIGDRFMVAWTSRRDTSYTKSILECIAKNDVCVAAKIVAGENYGKPDQTVMLNRYEVRFYPVPPGMPEAIGGSK